MRLWLSKNSDVPIHEQLLTQIILGIVSADLAAGEHLPSTGQLARKFQIHPNTVRAAYRELVRRGWAEWRHGSGFYVRTQNPEQKLAADLDLDRLISSFFQIARDRGYSLKEIHQRTARWLSIQPPDHILLIEGEDELRKILMTEISGNIRLPVVGASIEECSTPEKLLGSFCVALYDSAKEIRPVLPAEAPCLFLHSRSIPKSLTTELKPSPDTLITVVSRWADFLNWARTTLVAVGVDIRAIDLRDARQKGWRRGLESREFIITDVLVAQELPKTCRPHVFPIISDESLAELQHKMGV